MREIKFRFFDTEKNYMAYAGPETGLTDGDLLDYGMKAGYPVMQFTGTQDHLGTKVFEGDIVFLDAKMITGEIVMDCFAWKIKDRDEYYWLCDFYEDVQVVGNAHQHPHLLEQKK